MNAEDLAALRAFANEARSLAKRLHLVSLTPPPEDLHDAVEETWKRASSFAEGNLPPKGRASIGDIRDRLSAIRSQLGRRLPPQLGGVRAWRAYEKGARDSAEILGQLATLLEESLEASFPAVVQRQSGELLSRFGHARQENQQMPNSSPPPVATGEPQATGHPLELPPMGPKERAVLRILAERAPHCPINSEAIATELSRRSLPFTDAPGIRSRMIPKFKKLGLQRRGRLGYSFTADTLAQVRKALDPSADEMRMEGGR